MGRCAIAQLIMDKSWYLYSKLGCIDRLLAMPATISSKALPFMLADGQLGLWRRPAPSYTTEQEAKAKIEIG
ncbi:hypothetical protein C2W62_48360 [Candidatus Entotheonella serta]|nr:hypothetical protein C2W62_48360 [Candidatus Entotheonella serta]